jgi:hypothetical protein
MAKKSKRNKKASTNAGDGLRDAVERTWQGAGDAQKKVQDVFDDFGSALMRLRETLDERRVLDTLENLKDEVTGLARRVGQLEGVGGSRGRSGSGSSKPAAKRKPAARKSAAKRKPAARKTAAKRKPAARKTAAKRKPAARKTAAKRKPAAKSSASASSS